MGNGTILSCDHFCPDMSHTLTKILIVSPIHLPARHRDVDWDMKSFFIITALLALALVPGCASAPQKKSAASQQIEDWLNNTHGLNVEAFLDDRNGELRVHGLLSDVEWVGKIMEVADVAFGEFDAKKGKDIVKLLFPQTGIIEKYLNGVKVGEAKWKVSKEGELHAAYDINIVDVYTVHGYPDYKLIEIAKIGKSGKRKDYPKDEQVTYKYSINNLPLGPLEP